MAVQGFGAGDFMALSKFAMKIHSSVRESRANFGKLNIDAECLLVSISSLDKGPTQDLIIDYCERDEGDTHQQEVRTLRDGLNGVVMPFYALFDTRASAFKTPDGSKPLRPTNKPGVIIYVDGSSTDTSQPKERPWRRWSPTSWTQRLLVAFELKDLSDLRSRLITQSSNLNLFLTRLTHIQLHRQTELLTLRLSEQSLLRDNFSYSLDLSEATDDFREDVAAYIKFLLDGGKPFTSSELRTRKSEHSRYTRASQHGSGSLSKDHLRILEAQDLKARKEKLDEGNESILDDDARIKLAGARHRLALADLKNHNNDEATETTNSTTTTTEVDADRHRKSEQVILPHSPRPRPNELRRRASSAIWCNVCDRTILAEKTFYRCQSGRCGERSGDSYDLCRRCYSEGERCPGYDKETCADMSKLLWKESD